MKKKKKNVVYRSISFSDLHKAGYQIEVEQKESVILNGEEQERFQVTKVTKSGKPITNRQLMDALRFLGLKLNQYLHIVSIQEHVALDGKRTTCHRFLGEERSDTEWVKSGYASDEAFMSSSKYEDMGAYAHKLANGGDRS